MGTLLIIAIILKLEAAVSALIQYVRYLLPQVSGGGTSDEETPLRKNTPVVFFGIIIVVVRCYSSLPNNIRKGFPNWLTSGNFAKLFRCQKGLMPDFSCFLLN